MQVNRDLIIEFVKKLIDHYPIYGSQGLKKSQHLVCEYLQSTNWDNVYVDRFYAEEISNDQLYIDVAAFGSTYQQYDEVEKCNVIGILDSGKAGPTVILNGHIDVDILNAKFLVENKPSLAQVEGDILRGRGATDMLSGLTAMMVVSSIFANYKSNWCGKIIFCSVCDEEIGGNGTLRSLQFLKSHDYLTNNTYCIIGEPSMNRLCLESLGFMHVDYTFTADSVHMGVATKMNNSLYAAIDFINGFDDLLQSALKKVGLEYNPKQFKYNFGVVYGGDDSAIPIASLSLKSTLFFPEIIDANRFYDLIKSEIDQRYENISVSSTGISFPGASFQPFKLYDDLSKYESSDTFTSPCDARLYKNYNIPTIIYGPGSLEQAHSENEFINIQSIYEYADSLLKGLRDFLSVEKMNGSN